MRPRRISSVLHWPIACVSHLIVGFGQAQAWEARANRTTQMIHTSLWDATDKFYYYRDQSGTGDFIKIKIVRQFSSVLCTNMSPAYLDI